MTAKRIAAASTAVWRATAQAAGPPRPVSHAGMNQGSTRSADARSPAGPVACFLPCVLGCGGPGVAAFLREATPACGGGAA